MPAMKAAVRPAMAGARDVKLNPGLMMRTAPAMAKKSDRRWKGLIGFLEEYRGKEEDEEGTQFVEHRRVRKDQMIDTVEIEDDRNASEYTSQKEELPVLPTSPQTLSAVSENREGDDKTHEVTEHGLLHRRDIT